MMDCEDTESWKNVLEECILQQCPNPPGELSWSGLNSWFLFSVLIPGAWRFGVEEGRDQRRTAQHVLKFRCFQGEWRWRAPRAQHLHQGQSLQPLHAQHPLWAAKGSLQAATTLLCCKTRMLYTMGKVVSFSWDAISCGIGTPFPLSHVHSICI